MIKKIVPVVLAIVLITAMIVALRINAVSVDSKENETQSKPVQVVEKQTEAVLQTQAQPAQTELSLEQQLQNIQKLRKKTPKRSGAAKISEVGNQRLFEDYENYYGLPGIDLTGWEYPESIKTFESTCDLLRQKFPDGKYWNRMNDLENEDQITTDYYNVTDIPCDHEEYWEDYCNEYNGKSSSGYLIEDTSTQCMGFASLLSDLIFGENAPVLTYGNYDGIRIGDQARIYDGSHTVFILEKNDEYIRVVECNGDYETCMIKWDVIYYRWELDDAWYLTRWRD